MWSPSWSAKTSFCHKRLSPEFELWSKIKVKALIEIIARKQTNRRSQSNDKINALLPLLCLVCGVSPRTDAGTDPVGYHSTPAERCSEKLVDLVVLLTTKAGQAGSARRGGRRAGWAEPLGRAGSPGRNGRGMRAGTAGPVQQNFQHSAWEEMTSGEVKLNFFWSAWIIFTYCLCTT
jgi:hypothetical protein